jgi:opacity protein-like surface antigen
MLKINKFLALLSSVVICVSPKANEGFYVGISHGNMVSDIKLENIDNNFSDTHMVGGSTLNVGALAGYNHLVNETPILIGVELSAINHPATHEKKDNLASPSINFRFGIKTNNSLTASLRIGVVVKDLLFYGKVGLSKTNWNLNIDDFSTEHKAIQSNKKINSYGSDVGLGIDFSLNKSFTLGLDYKISYHENVNLNIPCGGIVKSSPTMHFCSLRVVYSF